LFDWQQERLDEEDEINVSVTSDSDLHPGEVDGADAMPVRQK